MGLKNRQKRQLGKQMQKLFKQNAKATSRCTQQRQGAQVHTIGNEARAPPIRADRKQRTHDRHMARV